MKIALFANGEVGCEVARHFTAECVAPIAVILVREDPAGNERIRRVSNATEFTEWSRHPGRDEVAHLRRLAPDLAILAWWPYILRPEVFTIPRLGCLNFHPSLLPHGRGKHPNFWALKAGTPFGVTLHFIDAGVDTGPLAFQQALPVSWEDTGETLYHRAREGLVALFKQNFQRIMAGDLPRQPQPPEAKFTHLARELEPGSEIELDRMYRARDLLNLLRARTFPPHPAAWFTDGAGAYEVRVEIRKRPTKANTA